jgi:hypothetical protein
MYIPTCVCVRICVRVIIYESTVYWNEKLEENLYEV